MCTQNGIFFGQLITNKIILKGTKSTSISPELASTSVEEGEREREAKREGEGEREQIWAEQALSVSVFLSLCLCLLPPHSRVLERLWAQQSVLSVRTAWNKSRTTVKDSPGKWMQRALRSLSCKLQQWLSLSLLSLLVLLLLLRMSTSTMKMRLVVLPAHAA